MSEFKTYFGSFASAYSSMAVFLFIAPCLIVASGYSYGALLLLIGGLFLIWKNPFLGFSPEDFVILWALLFYVVTVFFVNGYHHLPLSGFDKPARVLCAAFAFILLMRAPTRLGFFWSGLVFSTTSGLIWSICKLIAGDHRPSGYMNAIQYGDISLLFGSLCFIGYYSNFFGSQRCFKNYIFIVAAIAGSIGSLFSGSRGGWLSIPVVGFLIFSSNGFNFSRRRLLSGLFFLCVLIVVLYYLPDKYFMMRFTQTVDQVKRLLNNDAEGSSITVRLDMWRLGGKAFLERPLLGWGGLEEIKNTYPLEWKDISFDHLHNDFIDALVKRGLVGFLGLMALYFVPFALFIRRLKHTDNNVRILALLGATLVLSCMIFGLTQTFLAHISGVMIYAFMLIIIWSLFSYTLREPQGINR
jgi:O-antigen ligase